MPSCVFLKCNNNSRNTNKARGVTFHSFPQDQRCKEKWIKIIQVDKRDEEWLPTKFSKVCSEHFEANHLYVTPLGLRKLKPDAIPAFRAKREKKLIEDRMTATESNEPREMDCQPTALLQDTSKNNENSVDNEGSLQSPSDEKFNNEEIKCEIETFKNDENSVDNEGSLQSPSDEIFNNEEIKCEIETFKIDENSVDNDGSLQSPSDEIFNNEEMECEISKNNENSVDNDGSLQEPSDEILNQIKKECVTVPQQEETTIDFESDKSLDIPKTQKNSRLREKNKIIIRQQKKLAVQDKTIATQKRLIAKQVKVINSLKANIENLELKNDKLTKRNEFLRGSLQRLREKVLNENE
ncbi:THAP domain-containing protein 6-like isoform X5 [Pieris napi]|uniref:THAP domain-containing protein 6-like isoform X5 n=1 Tax=Pieris napi TaxID=78633 RepID=UPI001FB8C530|nr:THAP domain-containing protein 6-like isoform X5 [Pieris napi]